MIFVIARPNQTSYFVVVIITLTTLIVFIVIPSRARAGENVFGYRLSMSAAHDENATLAPENPEPNTAYSFRPSANYRYSDLRNRFDLNAQYSSIKNSISTRDSETRAASVGYSKQHETSEFGIRGAHSVQLLSTIETDFADRGIVENTTASRTDNNVRVSLQKNTSTTSLVSAIGSYTQTVFDSDNFNDFNSANLQLSVQKQISPKTAFVFQPAISYFETDFEAVTRLEEMIVDNFVVLPPNPLVDAIIEQETLVYDIQIGIERQFSERIEFSFSAGKSFVETTQDIFTEVQVSPATALRDETSFGGQDTINSNSDTQTLSLELAYDYRQNVQFSLDVSQRIEPSGGGSVRRSDSIDFNYSALISSRNLLGFRARYGRREIVDSDSVLQNQSPNREFFGVSLNHRYNYSPSWSMSFSLEFRQQQFDDSDSRASGASGSITLNYQPQNTIW